MGLGSMLRPRRLRSLLRHLSDVPLSSQTAPSAGASNEQHVPLYQSRYAGGAFLITTAQRRRSGRSDVEDLLLEGARIYLSAGREGWIQLAHAARRLGDSSVGSDGRRSSAMAIIFIIALLAVWFVAGIFAIGIVLIGGTFWLLATAIRKIFGPRRPPW